MSKNNYWIADAEGVYALVEGADQRDQWTKVHGWAATEQPGPTDQVHVVNENPDILPGRLPYAAVELHAGLGWKAGPPPVPVDATKDPVLVDQASPRFATGGVITEPVLKPKNQAATGATEKKESGLA